jgi:hypothetical protein
MKIIGVSLSNAPVSDNQAKKYSAAISRTGAAPLFVQIATRAKKRYARLSVRNTPGRQSLPPGDPTQQALELYNAQLRSSMEAEHLGQYIAIHPDTQTYAVEQRPGKAFRALRAQQPVGPIIVHNIGLANSGLKARMRGEQPG